MRAHRWPLIAAFGAIALVLSSCSGGGNDTPGPSTLTVKTASLNGAQETPAVTTAAFGSGSFTIDMGSGAIQGTVFTTNVPGVAAHIHEGPVGIAAPIIVTLEDAGGGTWRVPASTMLTPSQVDSLKNGNLYVNVHTAANPNGEIRGQIGRQVFFSTLTPGQETPPTTSTASGTGVFIFDPDTGTMSGTVTTTGVTALVAHMHIGPIGQAAAPVIPFTANGANGWTMPPTVLTADQITQLGQGNFYANVHSAANPNGEIRGQLYIPVRVANLTGAQETPPNSSTGGGQGVFVVDPSTRAIAGIETWAGVATATDSHIHNAGPGVAGGIVIRGTVTLGSSGKLVIASSTPLSDTLFVAFMKGNLYYNVHSQQFPGGEVRGQLSIVP
jgi:hypothetical protein